MQYDREDILHALTQHTARSMAQALALQIGLAAETEPEVFRDAIDRAFGLGHLVERYKKCMNAMHAFEQQLYEAGELLQSLAERVARVSRRLDGHEARMRDLETIRKAV